jgi:hypothetical protein
MKHYGIRILSKEENNIVVASSTDFVACSFGTSSFRFTHFYNHQGNVTYGMT